MSETAATDPRRNPYSGAILRKKYKGRYAKFCGFIERRVTYFPDPDFRWKHVRWTDGLKDYSVTIEAWRSWAKDAEVLKRGDENA